MPKLVHETLEKTPIFFEELSNYFASKKPLWSAKARGSDGEQSCIFSNALFQFLN